MQKCPQALWLAPGADGAAPSQGSGGWISSLLCHCSCLMCGAELVICSNPPGTWLWVSSEPCEYQAALGFFFLYRKSASFF